MRILNKIFGKNHKVKVQFIDSSNGYTIATSEMLAEQLPETFEIQTTMHLNDEDWSIEEAIPAHSKEFIQTKQLTLKMRKVEYVNPQDILYSLPTISNELPQISDSNLFNDFEYSIIEDDWRQNEFLNKSSFPLIEIEVAKIDELKENDSEEVDAEFTAYKNCHLRDTIGEPNLNISLQQIKSILNIDNVGSLKVINEFVKDGFSLKTDSTTFYGTIENGIVKQLCIGEFSDNTSKDVHQIINEFDLIFIGWCHCQIITSDD